MGQLKNKLYWVAAFLLLLHWSKIIVTGERLLTKLLEFGLLKLFHAMVITISLIIILLIICAINEILTYRHNQNKGNSASNLIKIIWKALEPAISLNGEINIWLEQEARQNSFLKLEKKITHTKNALIESKMELARLIRLRDNASTLNPAQLLRLQKNIGKIKTTISALEQDIDWLEMNKQYICRAADVEKLNKEIEESEANVNRLFTRQTTWSNGNEDNRLIEDSTSHYMEWSIKSYNPRDLL